MLNVSRILVFVTIAAFMGTSGIAIAQNAPPPQQSQPMTGQPMPGQPTTGQPKPKKKGCKIKGCPKNKEKKAAQRAASGAPPVNPPQ
ncbi:MAG TPA: hypothetical protein VGI19_19765 [Candidatus Cybelea sp.]|jgi:hypothetical protein